MPSLRIGPVPTFVLTVAAALLFPMLAYAVAVYRTFDFVLPSAYAPVEEFGAALDSLSISQIWSAPLLSVNMTSGNLVAAMYTVTPGAVLLALLLGGATALWSAVRARAVCRRAGGGMAAGTGVVASIMAAQTTLMGCCGGGLAGGLLSLAGLGSATAAQASAFGQPIQAAVALILLALSLRTGRLST